MHYTVKVAREGSAYGLQAHVLKEVLSASASKLNTTWKRPDRNRSRFDLAWFRGTQSEVLQLEDTTWNNVECRPRSQLLWCSSVRDNRIRFDCVRTQEDAFNIYRLQQIELYISTIFAVDILRLPHRLLDFNQQLSSELYWWAFPMEWRQA